MDNSKKENLSKVVLNVTTYEQHPANKDVEFSKNTAIDITDLLAEYDIYDTFQINGVSSCEINETSSGEEHAFSAKFAISGSEMNALKRELYSIIDAAIVNDKQGKAIKKLIDDRFDEFSNKHWEPIKQCDFTKDYYDRIIAQEADE